MPTRGTITALLAFGLVTLVQAQDLSSEIEAEARVALTDARAQLGQVAASAGTGRIHFATLLGDRLAAARELVDALPKGARRAALSDEVNLLAFECALTRRTGEAPNELPVLDLEDHVRPLVHLGHLRQTARSRVIQALRAVHALRWASAFSRVHPEEAPAAVAALRGEPGVEPYAKLFEPLLGHLGRLPADALLAEGQAPPEEVVIFSEELPADPEFDPDPATGATTAEVATPARRTPPARPPGKATERALDDRGPQETPAVPEPILKPSESVVTAGSTGGVGVGIAWCPRGTRVVLRHTPPSGQAFVALDEVNRVGGVPFDVGTGLGTSMRHNFHAPAGVHRFEVEVSLPSGEVLRARAAVIAR